MSVKVAIVLLVALVGLFVTALVVGVRRDDAAGGEAGSLVDRLRGAAPTNLVDRKDVRADCVDTTVPDVLVLAFDGGCTLEVRGADEIRFVRLESTVAFELEAPAPRIGADPPEVDPIVTDFAAGTIVDFPVGRAEEDEEFVEIELDCDGDGCRVTVGTGGTEG